MKRSFTTKIICYKKDKGFLAVALDFDLIDEGDFLGEALSRLEENILGYLRMCLKEGESEKSPDYHEAIENYLKGSELSLSISNIKQSSGTSDQEKSIISSVAKNFKKVSDFSHQVIFWLILIFIIGGTLIIFNAIQLTIFTRRKEINIMRLVGANISFIHLPFIIEAIMYAVFAVLFNLLLLAVVSKQIDIESTNLFTFSQNINIMRLTVLELIITIVLSLCSSLLAVSSYLKRPISTEE